MSVLKNSSSKDAEREGVIFGGDKSDSEISVKPER